MRIRLSTIKAGILYLMVFYILNKNLVDWIFNGYSKYLYYAAVAIGMLLCIVHFIYKKTVRRAFILYVIYVVVILFNGLTLSNSEQLSVGVIEYITYPMAFFAILYYLEGLRDINALLNRMCGWAGFTSVLAFLEYILGKSILPDFEGRIYTYANGSSTYRATVFIGSPMMLCVLLGTMMILSFYFYHMKRKKFYLILIALDILGMLATGSRGPLVLSVMGILVMYYFFFKRRMASSNTKVWLLFAFFLGGVSLIIIMLFPNIHTGISSLDFFVYRMSTTLDFSGEWGNAERLVRWSYYIGEFLKKPLLGYGIATTSAAVTSNQAVTVHGITTESGLLARFVETGLLGTLSYYVFVISTLRMGLKNIRKRVTSDNTLVFVAGVVALILLEDIILQISLDIFCTFIFWFVLAYAISTQLYIAPVKQYTMVQTTLKEY